MATLTAKVTESITLASGTVDSTNTLTISNISDVSKRVVTAAVAETFLVGFATAGSTNLSKSYVAGQFDEDEALYLRITNLDSTYHCTLTFKCAGNVVLPVTDNSPPIDASSVTSKSSVDFKCSP